jgi:large subunit ribosomal protein L10
MTDTTTRAPRQHKVDTVAEITERLRSADAVFVSEYRGMTVKQITQLRGTLRGIGAEHTVYKNTLARFAATEAGVEGLSDVLVGPTALTFVTGDVAAAAKVLRDIAKTNPLLVIKGGVLGGAVLSGNFAYGLAALIDKQAA